MDKRKVPFFSIVLYILAGLIFLYSIWGVLYCRNYIAKAIAGGQLTVGGNEFQVFNFYMTNSIQYLITAIILFSLGCILHKLEHRTVEHLDPGDRGIPPAKQPLGEKHEVDIDDFDEDDKK